MNHFTSIIAVLLFFSVKSYAQSDTCKVQIDIRSLIEPRQKLLIHVEIWHDNEKISQSNQVSHYCFINIPKEGKYKLVITSKGYLTKIDTLELFCGTPISTLIELTPISLESLKVKDNVDENEAREIATFVFNLKSIFGSDISVKEGYYKTIPVWECVTSLKSNNAKRSSSTTKYIAIDKSTGKVIRRGTSGTRKTIPYNESTPIRRIKKQKKSE